MTMRYLRFVVLFFIIALLGFYFHISKQYGIDCINIDFFAYLLAKNELLELLKRYSLISFLISFPLFLVTSYKQTKPTLLYYAVLIFCADFFCLFYTLTLSEKFRADIVPEQIQKSDTASFYQENYHDAKTTKITAPQKKKNVILIVLESMENTFADKELVGENLIPFLAETAERNISFNNFTDGYATHWTQSALTASMTGIPSSFVLPMAKDPNKATENLNTFLPSVYSLGEILRDNGYNRLFVQGGDLAFSGTDIFINSHGFKDCAFGLQELKEYNKPENAWGIGDKDIYPIFEDKLSKIDKNNPFFSVLYTIDSHHYNVPPDTPQKFDTRSKDVIYQASENVKQFVTWFNAQSFAKETILIIVGDHLRMMGGKKSGSGFLNNIPRNKRAIYNAFINTGLENTVTDKNRTFTQIDLFPTILEAAGFNIDGHKLGLGVSVFSNEKTLIEQHGKNNLKEMLKAKDSFYNKLWE